MKQQGLINQANSGSSEEIDTYINMHEGSWKKNNVIVIKLIKRWPLEDRWKEIILVANLKF